MFDIIALEKEAKAAVAESFAKGAKDALIKKYREQQLAQRVLQNIDREIQDLLQSIADGSFVTK